MADRNDLRGPYQDHIDLTQMSKEWLIQLLNVWQVWFAQINAGLFQSLLAKGMSMEEVTDVVVQTMTPAYQKCMPMLNKLAGLDPPQTMLEYNTVAGLAIDGNLTKASTFESKEKIIDENHFTSTVTHCPYLEEMEKLGVPELVTAICHGVEAKLMPLVYQIDPENPQIEITFLIEPPRKSPNDPACAYDFQYIGKKK